MKAILVCAVAVLLLGRAEAGTAVTAATVFRGPTLPDLVVDDLSIVGGEVHFVIRNVGPGVKRPAVLNYEITATYGGTGTATQSGVAAITSLYRLGPGEAAGEDRAVPNTLIFTETMSLRFCINPDARVAETDLTNNCRTRTSTQLLPDLHLASAAMEIYEPEEDESWYEDLWDLLTGGLTEFDVSGVRMDKVLLRVRNEGAVPVAGFRIAVVIGRNGREPERREIVFRETIAPNRVASIPILLPFDATRWSDPDCCGGVADLDPRQRLAESDEGDNKRSFIAVRVGRDETRPRVRDHR